MMIVPVTEMEYLKGKALFDAAAEFTFKAAPRDEKELAEMIRRHACRAVVVGVDVYEKALYDALPRGGLLQRFGVGIDGIHGELCRANGIFAANTPGVLDQSVAEHTIFLIGDLVRHISHLNANVKQGQWHPQAGREMNELSLAIIGLGHIGAMVARIAHQSFGMDLLVCEVAPPESTAKRLGFTDKDEMFSTLGIRQWSADSADILPLADVVSVHLPVIPQTLGYCNKARFDQCKPGALFVNTARGKLVVEDDLAQALSDGRLGGAGLDVFLQEPYLPKKVDLRGLENVIMTPHVASNTGAANRRIAQAVIENLRNWQAGEMEKVSLVF